MWFVEDTASAASLTEAVNCSGGTFDVIWRGSVVINRTIEIPDGTTVYLSGEGSGAEVNGGGKTRLFKATGATLHISNMLLRNGNAAYGGGIATERSDVFISHTSCSGNIASSYVGVAYVGRSSTLVWDGQATFKDNHAGYGSGVIAVSDNSNISWDGVMSFTNNTSSYGGGALFVYVNSFASWNGITSFISNYADHRGGAVHAYDNSIVKWDGNTYFINNTSNDEGGAVYAYHKSIVEWDGNTSFINNYADDEGGAVYINSKSIIKWDGNTSFIDNTGGVVSGGGALVVRGSSSASWRGVTLFIGNSAFIGGAFSLRHSIASWDGTTSFIANIGVRGGAGHFYNQCTASWGGITSFINNTAFDNGGGLSIELDSEVLWTAETYFTNIMADSDGGLDFQPGANISRATKTSFINNNAMEGGALSLRSGATVSWTVETSFTGNNVDTNGGAIHVISVGSNVTIGGDTNFRQNSAGADGGAVYAYVGYDEAIPSYVIVDNDTDVFFEGNICQVNGGGIALIGPVVTRFNSNMTFSENYAGVAGGAVYMSGVSLGLRLEVARFISNSAVIGGAVYTTRSGTAIAEDDHGTPQENPTTFIGCEFIGNKAQKTGGALESGAGIDFIVNTSFVRNTAAIGGALRLVGAISLQGCDFIENSSDEDEGPGVSNDGVNLDLSRCTFVENIFNCQPGFYLEYNETDALFDTVCKGCNTQCNECTVEGKQPVCLEELEHSSAAGGNATLELLSIEPGYWRATADSIDILACYNTKACRGGVTGDEGYCHKAYEGPYCSVCSEGYTSSSGFVCTKCFDNITGDIALAVVGIVVFLSAFITFISYMLSGKSENADRGIVARVVRFIPLHSVKIIIVVWQIITQFSSVVNVVFPSVYQDFLDSVDILNFDLTWVLSAGCIVDADFHDKLLLATLGPLVSMAILGGTYIVAMHRSCDSEDARKAIRHKHVSMVLLLTFLIYSSASSTLFKTFACDDLDDGKIYLRADYRIECSSSKHIALKIYARFMVILYVIGIPVFYGAILYRNREALTMITGREDDEIIKPFTDLWKPYKPGRFYYEVIECVRRVLLTGALVFIYPNTAAQIAAALMMAAFFMIVSEALAPHALPWDRWCNRTGHGIVFMTIFLALLLRVDVSGERASSQEIFESVLIAAHACLLLIVVIEAIAVVMAWRQVIEDIAPQPLVTWNVP